MCEREEGNMLSFELGIFSTMKYSAMTRAVEPDFKKSNKAALSHRPTYLIAYHWYITSLVHFTSFLLNYRSWWRQKPKEDACISEDWKAYKQLDFYS